MTTFPALRSETVKPVAEKFQVIKCLIIFLLAFGLHQTANFLLNADPSLGWTSSLVLFTTALLPLLFIKFEGADFGKHGFLAPPRTRRLLTMSLFLAVLYVLIVLFIPGSMSWFEATSPPRLSLDLLYAGGSIVLASFATETILRGYAQTKLTSTYGFFVAAIAVSAMFTLYMLPITLYSTFDMAALLGQALPLLAESVFLCFLFRETETILCPIVFTATVILLETFTPLRAISTEYSVSLTIIVYVVLVPIMQVFVGDVRKQNVKFDETAIMESEQHHDSENS